MGVLEAGIVCFIPDLCNLVLTLNCAHKENEESSKDSKYLTECKKELL